MSTREVNRKILISDIYPQLSAEEQQEAEANLRRYLGVVVEIFEHIKANNPQMLTELDQRARLRKERRRNKRNFFLNH